MTQEPDQDLLFCSDCECDYPCGGDSSESCGGYYRYNLYQVEREGEQKNKIIIILLVTINTYH